MYNQTKACGGACAHTYAYRQTHTHTKSSNLQRKASILPAEWKGAWSVFRFQPGSGLDR